MPTPAELPVSERNAAIAVYPSEVEAEAGVRELERGGFDMTKLSLLAQGMNEERHVIGTETGGRRTARWAGFGSVWGLLVGAFFWIPGVGHVAVGGYLLYILTTTVFGAASGALAGALTSIGIPEGGVLQYETDLRQVAAHRPRDVGDGRPRARHPRHERRRARRRSQDSGRRRLSPGARGSRAATASHGALTRRRGT